MNGQLNSLTSGQIQRKIQQALSILKNDDHQVNRRPIFQNVKLSRYPENHRRQQRDCDGKMDSLVTVRQIEQPPPRPENVSSEHAWKTYVDRLMAKGSSPGEIQRLLQEAAETNMQRDHEKLKIVFDYINRKMKPSESERSSSGIQFFTDSTKKLASSQPFFQHTNIAKTEKSLENGSKHKTILSTEATFASVCYFRFDFFCFDIRTKNVWSHSY